MLRRSGWLWPVTELNILLAFLVFLFDETMDLCASIRGSQFYDLGRLLTLNEIVLSSSFSILN